MLILFSLLLLGLSVAVLLQDRLLNAVILLGVFSLVSSAIYFIIGAPDVAVTEGAIGVAFVTFIYVLALSDQGKLHVIAEEIPPFLFQEKGELRGAELEILREFAEEISLELEVEFVGHQELTSLIGGRRADLIAGAYFAGYLAGEDLSTSEGYNGSQLAKISSTYSDEASLGLMVDMDAIDRLDVTEEKLVQFTSLEEMIEAYNKGQISGFIADSGRMSTALYRINSSLREKSEIETLGDIEYAFAVSSGEEDLLDELNDHISYLKRSGEIDDLLSGFFR